MSIPLICSDRECGTCDDPRFIKIRNNTQQPDKGGHGDVLLQLRLLRCVYWGNSFHRVTTHLFTG